MNTRRSPRNQDTLWRALGAPALTKRANPSTPALVSPGREWNPCSVRQDRRCMRCGLYTQGGSRPKGATKYTALCEICNAKVAVSNGKG